jgi:hypothetical protein
MDTLLLPMLGTVMSLISRVGRRLLLSEATAKMAYGKKYIKINNQSKCSDKFLFLYFC